MSKLSDIIDAATADSTSVATLLRMVKVVAARMEAPPLIDWVDNELGGYVAGAPVPNYRGPFRTDVLSEWTGPFSSIARNIPVPTLWVPEDMRDLGGFEVTFYESVSELERLAKLDSLTYRWPADGIAVLNGRITRGEITPIVRDSVLVSADRISSPERAGSAVDSVRTRVLDLALELEKVTPDAGEPGVAPVDKTTVRNIITNIYGHGNAVAVASPGAGQLGGVQAGNLGDLLKAVADLGFEPEDVAELKKSIQGDEGDVQTPAGQPGRRVTRFLGKAALGGVASAGKDVVQEGVKMLGELVRAYYGI